MDAQALCLGEAFARMRGQAGRRAPGVGLLDLAGQVQSRALGDLMLTTKQLRCPRGAKVLLDEVPQRPGLITAVLDRADRQTGQRLLQELPPGGRGAICRVAFRQTVVRQRVDGHPADRGMEGLVRPRRKLPSRHADDQRRPLHGPHSAPAG